MNQEQIFPKRLKIHQNAFAVQNITGKIAVSRILCGMDISPDLHFHGKNCDDGPKADESFMHCRSIMNLIFSKLEFKVSRMWLTFLSFKSQITPLLELQKVNVCRIPLFPTFESIFISELHFLDKFKNGWMAEFQSQIIWIMLPYFSDKGKDNGWYADAFIRMYLSKMGLKLVHNQRDDDLFLLLVSINAYILT